MDLGTAGIGFLLNRAQRDRERDEWGVSQPLGATGARDEEALGRHYQTVGQGKFSEQEIQKLLNGEAVPNPSGQGYILPVEDYPRGGGGGLPAVPLSLEIPLGGYQGGPTQTGFQPTLGYETYDPKKGSGKPPWMTGGTAPGGTAPPVPGSTGGDGGNILDTIGSFVTENPELVTGLAGTAVDVYGAVQEGKARDRELELLERREEARQEEARRRQELDEKRRRDEQIYQLLGAMSRGL